jgi:hypothetical protein
MRRARNAISNLSLAGIENQQDHDCRRAILFESDTSGKQLDGGRSEGSCFFNFLGETEKRSTTAAIVG